MMESPGSTLSRALCGRATGNSQRSRRIGSWRVIRMLKWRRHIHTYIQTYIHVFAPWYFWPAPVPLFLVRYSRYRRVTTTTSSKCIAASRLPWEKLRYMRAHGLLMNARNDEGIICSDMYTRYVYVCIHRYRPTKKTTPFSKNLSVYIYCCTRTKVLLYTATTNALLYLSIYPAIHLSI